MYQQQSKASAEKVACCLSLILFCTVVTAQDQQAESLRRTPTDIKTYLDKKYPGWKFLAVPPSAVMCRDAETKLHPSLVRADFNGDGQPDYALQIEHSSGIRVFEFLSGGKTPSVHQLFARKSIPMNDRPALVLERKGQKTEVDTVEKVDSLKVSGCDSIPMRFVYRNGRVRNDSPND